MLIAATINPHEDSAVLSEALVNARTLDTVLLSEDGQSHLIRRTCAISPNGHLQTCSLSKHDDIIDLKNPTLPRLSWESPVGLLHRVLYQDWGEQGIFTEAHPLVSPRIAYPTEKCAQGTSGPGDVSGTQKGKRRKEVFEGRSLRPKLASKSLACLFEDEV